MLSQILAILSPQEGEQLLEIGPGDGALTGRLLGEKADLIAVEIDSDWVERLKHRWPKLKLIHSDILKLELPPLTADKKWRLVGNLPYNISTPLLARLPSWQKKIQDVLFMLQAEVAERLNADPGSRKRSRLGVMLQHGFDINMQELIPPEAFYPPPAVYSRLVQLKPKQNPLILKNPQLFAGLVKASFNQRRKTLRAALKRSAAFPSSVDWAHHFKQAEVSGQSRAEQLSVADFVRLANNLCQEKNHE